MSKLTASVFSAAIVVLVTSPSLAARDDQWVEKREWGDRSAHPSAIFLSWDYSKVLFRATCDRQRRELVLVYFGDGETTLTSRDSLVIRGLKPIPLRTQLVDGRLEGRVGITEDLLRSLTTSRELEIEGPNTMGEPWHVGRAMALRRLTSSCG